MHFIYSESKRENNFAKFLLLFSDVNYFDNIRGKHLTFLTLLQYNFVNDSTDRLFSPENHVQTVVEENSHFVYH